MLHSNLKQSSIYQYPNQMATAYQQHAPGFSRQIYYPPSYWSRSNPTRSGYPPAPPRPLSRAEQIQQDAALAAAIAHHEEQQLLRESMWTARRSQQSTWLGSYTSAKPDISQPEIFIPPLPAVERTPTSPSTSATQEEMTANAEEITSDSSAPDTKQPVLLSSTPFKAIARTSSPNIEARSSASENESIKVVSAVENSPLHPQNRSSKVDWEPTTRPNDRASATHDKKTSPEHIARRLRRHRDMFTASFACSKCGVDLVVSPMVDRSLGEQIHLTCEKCQIIHCRGCRNPVKCKPHCKTHPGSCSLRMCCSKGRAIAIFEILCGFDKALAAAIDNFRAEPDTSDSGIWPIPAVDRASFLEIAASGVDDRFSRRYNRSFKDTLEQLLAWLPPRESVHNSVPSLLSTSFLLEVVGTYLGSDVRGHFNWVVYCSVYVAILKLIHRLHEVSSGTRDLVVKPFATVDTSSGLQSWVWDPQGRWSAGPLIDASFMETALSRTVSTDLGQLSRLPAAKNSISEVEMILHQLRLADMLGSSAL